jgi:signal transduction histidine kinase
MIRAGRSWVLSLVLLSGRGAWAVDAPPLPAWDQEHFMSESGLLQNRVHTMVRDDWGGLLIGTEGGLVRYDGHHFRQIGINVQEGLWPSRVLEIIPTADSAFVVRDAGSRQFVYRNDRLEGVTIHAPARKYVTRFAGKMPDAVVAVRALDPDSAMDHKHLWPAAARVVVLEGERWCIRTDTTLFIYQRDSMVAAIPVPFGRTTALFPMDGDLYTITPEGAVFRVDIGARKAVPVARTGFPAEMANGNFRLFWDPQAGVAAIQLGHECYRLRTDGQGGMEAVPTGLVLPTDTRVVTLVWLSDDAVAMGTDTKGLYIFRRHVMRNLLCPATAEGVNNAYMAQAPYGRSQVITSDRAGVRVFGPGGCMAEEGPVARFNDTAILLDREERYWYGRGDTLFLYDPVEQEERVMRVGLRPLCFSQEADGTIWIGASSGVYRVSQGRVFLHVPIAQGDLAYRPMAIARTQQGELWIATCAGVLRVTDRGGWEMVKGLEGVCARELAVVKGLMLVGTYGAGAFMVREGIVARLPMDGRGFLSHVHAFMPDSAGFLWMSTNQGLFRARTEDLVEWVADTTQLVHYAYYGKRSGIGNAEFNGGSSPNYVRTRDGWASFPTMDGLVWFRPEEVPDGFPQNGLLLEGMEVDGRPWAPHTPLPWQHRSAVVHLSLSYWGDRENVRLEYMLDGDGPAGWVPLPIGECEVRLGIVPTGRHILRVRKVGAPLRGDLHEFVLPLNVPAPFFKQPWFFLASALLLGLLFVAAIRLNAMRLHRRNLQLEKVVAERTSELLQANEGLRRSLAMKEMLVSIISHDIVTPLRFLARVSSGAVRRLPVTPDPELEGTVSDIAQSANKLFDNAQDLLQWIKRQDGRIALRHREHAVHRIVEDVLRREEERASDNGTRLVNAIPPEHHVVTDRNVLAIILHNAVANAVTHTRGGTVTVSGAVMDGTYQLRVSDDGPGMPPAVLAHVHRIQHQGALGAMNADGERDVQGLGLLIIADLLALLGGHFTVDSAEGRGTIIALHIPLDPPGNAEQRERVTAM